MTAPSFRAVEAKSLNGSTTLTVTIPASTQVGDFLLFTASTIGGSTSTPAGWTAIDVNPTSGSPFNTIYAYYRWAQSGDAGTNVTLTLSGTTAGAGAITAWADATSYEGYGAYTASTYDTTIPAPAVAVDATSTLTIAAYGASETGGTPSITEPNTSRANIGGFYINEGARLAVGSDTNDPNITRTATTSSSRRNALTIVIKGGSTVKRWTGAAWEPKPLMRWDGTDWVSTVLKRWNGTSWEAV